MNTAVATKNEALRRAKLVSDIFHPWSVLVPVLAMAAYQATGSITGCIQWTLVAYLPAIILPLLYAKARATRLSRGGTQHNISRSLVRNEPKQLFIMAGLFGIPSAAILYCLSGPINLFIIILGITAVMLVLALVNTTYRASFHLGMVTGMLTSLWFLFGNVSLIGSLLLPILGYSRYQLGEHTPTQMVAGFLIGLVVSGATFYRFGFPPVG